MGKIVWVSVASALFLICLKGASAYFPSDHNMKALHNFLEEVGGADTDVALFDEASLYGLQYYLNGRVERVSDSGEEPWADASIDELVMESDAAPPTRQCVVITKRKRSDQLTEIFNGNGVTYDRRESGGWTLFFMRGKA